jgi:membrane fusion protein, heavy metal efflux system
MSSAVSRLILGSLIVLTGCGTTATQQAPANSQSDGGQDTEYIASDARGIQTMTVQSSSIPDYMELPAHIDPDPTRVVHVYPPAGGRIVELEVRPWDRVEKGQMLATLESGDLSRAVADYHKALVDSQVKDESLKRSEDLLAHHAIAVKDYQEAQAEAQSARAELEATREQIRVFGMDPDHASSQLRLTAPRSGVILDVGAAPGEFSNALSAPQPLCTIADLSTVWAVGDIYEKDLRAIKAGDPALVTLNAYPDQHWSGRVSVVSDAVDPNTRTLHVRVTLPNPGTKLKPAMFGSIRLLRSSAEGILVPAAAVIREGTAAYVYVGEGNGRYRRHDVSLGRTVGDSLELTSGVKPGDTIITQGALLLRAASQS